MLIASSSTERYKGRRSRRRRIASNLQPPLLGWSSPPPSKHSLPRRSYCDIISGGGSEFDCNFYVSYFDRFTGRPVMGQVDDVINIDTHFISRLSLDQFYQNFDHIATGNKKVTSADLENVGQGHISQRVISHLLSN